MEIKPSNPKIVHHVVVYAIEPDAPEGTPEGGVHAPRIRRRQIRRHLRRQHRPAAEEGHAAALRHALLRGRIRAAQQDDDRVQVLSERRDAEIPGAIVRPIRNIPNDELEVPPNTVVRTDGYFRLPRPARIDAFQPHMHMRGRGLTVEAIDPVTNRTFDPQLGRSLRLQLAHQLRLRRRGGAAAAGRDGAAPDRHPRQHVGQPAQSRSEHVGRLRRAQRRRHAPGLARHGLTWTRRNISGSWTNASRSLRRSETRAQQQR